MFSKKVGKRSLAVLMSILMLGNEVLPAAAAGEESIGDAVVCADEQENAVSENTPEDGSVEADPAEDQTAADEQEVSENDAVSDNNAVSENDTDDADVEEDENEAENAADVSTEEEDAADGEIVWKEPAADWYKDFEYKTKDGNIYLTKAKDSLEGNVVIPAKATISGKEYSVYLRKPDDSFAKSIWPRESEKLTGLKFEGGVRVDGDSCYHMFAWINNISVIDVNGLDISGITDLSYMFRGCTALTEIDIEKMDTSNIRNMDNMFLNCVSLTKVDVSGFNTANVETMGGMFCKCASIKEIDVSGFDTAKVTSMASMFQECESLTELDVSGFDTSNVTDIGSMFRGCKNITNLDVSGFDTTKVTSLEGMFLECSKLEELDVSRFDTSKATSMFSLFFGCESLKEIDVSGFDTANVEDFTQMFWGCSQLEKVDVTGFDTSKATSMYGMFCKCSGLKVLDLSSFKMPNVKEFYNMFGDCTSLERISWGSPLTKKAVSFDWMFSNCKKLKELDMSGFRTSKVTDMNHMFNGCESLEKIDVSSFDTAKVENMTAMFYDCKSLKELDIRHFRISEACRVGNDGFSWMINRTPVVYLPVKWVKNYSGWYNDVKKIYYAGSREEWQALDNSVPDSIEVIFDHTEGMKVLEPEIWHSPLDPQPEIDDSITDLYLVKGQKFVLDGGWESSDKKALSISKTGVVKAKKVTDSVQIKKGERSISIHISKPTWKRKTFSGSFFTTFGMGYENPFEFSYDKNLEILWTSNKPNVAVVDEKGVVSCRGKGTATITAYINGVAYKFKIKCKNPEKNALLNCSKEYHMNVGEAKTVFTKTGKKAEWYIYNENILQPEKKYKLKGIKVGRTSIETTYMDRYCDLAIYVEDATIITDGVNIIKKNNYTVDLSVGDIKKIDYVYLQQAVIYKSNKPEVAIIDEYGNLIARKAGKATLTTTINGKKIKITVNVKEKQ